MIEITKRMRERMTDDIAALGSMPSSAVLLLLLLLFGDRALAWQLALGLLIALTFLIPLRLLLPRERPRPRAARGLLTRIDARSFPSAHAMRSSLAATLITLTYPTLPVILIALVLVGLVSFARILQGEHRWCDVLVGLLLGGAIALAIWAKPL